MDDYVRKFKGTRFSKDRSNKMIHTLNYSLIYFSTLTLSCDVKNPPAPIIYLHSKDIHGCDIPYGNTTL